MSTDLLAALLAGVVGAAGLVVSALNNRQQKNTAEGEQGLKRIELSLVAQDERIDDLVKEVTYVRSQFRLAMTYIRTLRGHIESTGNTVPEPPEGLDL